MNYMKKELFILGLAGCLFALPACTEGDEAEEPTAASAITLNAVVPNCSRGVVTTTASIKDFVVYAFTEGSMLMNGVTVTREGGLWTYSPPAYWPVESVNFYAYSPVIKTSTDISGDGGGHIPGYLNNYNVDLLYAVRKDVMQQAAPVSLNFRHALSNVRMVLSSTNPRIKVLVSYISLKNVYREGSFDFPQASTLASTPDVVGSWTDLKSLSDMMTFAIIGKEDRAELTPQPTDYTLNNLDCSYVIPQPLTDVQLSANGYSGTYIEVDCEIFDTVTGIKLWPNAKTPDYMLVPETETGRIVYPATSDQVNAYLPGHAYIYNIRINNPDVLDMIEFDVTVDDYSIDQM